MTKAMTALQAIATPAYVADVAKLRANLAKVTWLKEQTGCQVLLAAKAFSMFSLFPMFSEALDGITASGLFEARLGHEEFGGEVHAYSPAFSDAEIDALLPICSHIYFNSEDQLRRFAPRFRERYGADACIGLRLNPQLSLVRNSSLYDPSSPGCRFGVAPESVSDALMQEVDLLHVHNLCENPVEDSVRLVDHLIATVPHLLEQVRYVNLGGGHYLTTAGYDLEALASAVRKLQERFGVTVILEPGGALVYDAGYLVSTVLDVLPGQRIALLDTSATCHMPDVLEVPYTPYVEGAEILASAAEKCGPNDVTLAGKTCLAGDVIGHYRFASPLKPGDKVIFQDMMQYSMVKNTTFNGLPLPDIGILEEDGRYRLVRHFGYEDFKSRLS